MILVWLTAVLASVSGLGWSLEAAALDSTRNATVPLEMRVAALQSALKAAFDEFTARTKVCAAKVALYAPGVPGADADGCKLIPSAFPAGMISAFHSNACPSGWSDAYWLAGRTIAGLGGPNGYVLGSGGGADFVTLTAWNLPQHAHTYSYKGHGSFLRQVNGNDAFLYAEAAYTGTTSNCTNWSL